MARPKKKNPRNKELRVRLTDQEYAKLSTRAAVKGQTVADYVRVLLSYPMEMYGKKEE
jgi:hypothetical protein